eukprot:scaffold33509_cov155-Skeletonema_dohrnii-CCMP3373.AAC.1
MSFGHGEPGPLRTCSCICFVSQSVTRDTCRELRDHNHTAQQRHITTKVHIMKASTSTASLLLAMIMAVAHPLTTWAHKDESVRIDTVSSDASASILRGVTSNQEEERNLAKGGGGGNKKDSTPRLQLPPSSPAPSPAPTTPQCENPPDGQCNGRNSCCEGYSCKGKACRMNGRQLRERKLSFKEATTEGRKLADCVDLRCNEYDNAPLCESDLPSSRPASNICNYGGGEYTALVQTCDGAVDLCCEDGNGGYYYGLTRWISYQGGTCCPK